MNRSFRVTLEVSVYDGTLDEAVRAVREALEKQDRCPESYRTSEAHGRRICMRGTSGVWIVEAGSVWIWGR